MTHEPLSAEELSRRMHNLIVHTLLLEAPALLAEHYTPNCCIPATSIAVKVFERFKVPAQPVTVKVMFQNRAAVMLFEKYSHEQATELMAQFGPDDRGGPWTMGLGVPDFNRTEQDYRDNNEWQGHMCVYLPDAPEGPGILDLTIQQASRHHKRLAVEPMYSVVPPEWLESGQLAGWRGDDGSEMVVIADSGNRSYETSPQWNPVGERADIQQQIVEALVAAVHRNSES